MKSLWSVIVAISLMSGMQVACFAEEAREEAVTFRHPKPATVRFLDRKLAEDYARRLRSVGCSATLSWHWGHTDLNYQCEEWRVVRCADHEEARDWMRFLGVLCFESSHIH